jgi:hypothetical protein
MILEKQLIQNTKPNMNSRVYPLETLEHIKLQIEKYNTEVGLDLGTLGSTNSPVVLVKDIAFRYYNPQIENEALYVDIEVLETKAGIKLKKFLEKDVVVFRLAGYVEYKDEDEAIDTAAALLNLNYIVGTDYKLMTINAIPKEDDSLNF